MSRFSKRYADGLQKDQRWRKYNGMRPGRKEFEPRPSSHALARQKKVLSVMKRIMGFGMDTEIGGRQMTEQTKDTFEQWCILEIFGHERIAGRVTEQRIGGSSFVRVDVPDTSGAPGFTRLYGEKAIYSITPVTEELACRAASSMKVAPINIYIPALAASSIASDDEDEDDTGREDDDFGDDDD